MVWLFEKNDIPLHSQTKGTLAEWLGNGLQNRVRRFESARYLKRELSSDSSLFFFLYTPRYTSYVNIFPSTEKHVVKHKNELLDFLHVR